MNDGPAAESNGDAAVNVQRLSHHYGQRQALRELSLRIERGEIFGVLGKNGCGKTTLFRVLSTLIRPQSGEVQVLGETLPQHAFAVRRQIGVVFQAPSLDKKLTVAENIRHQAALYAVPRNEVAARLTRLLEQFELADRAGERVETLSGGLRRRAELAKAMISQPRLLLMDEPTAALDPGARAGLWRCLQQLREQGATIVLTTHLLEVAARCDRLAIIDQGQLVVQGTPDLLRSTVGGDTISIQTGAADLAAAIRTKFQLEAQHVDDQLRLELPDGHLWVPRLMEAFPGKIAAIRLGKPTLEDVFIHHTGQHWS